MRDWIIGYLLLVLAFLKVFHGVVSKPTPMRSYPPTGAAATCPRPASQEQPSRRAA